MQDLWMQVEDLKNKLQYSIRELRKNGDAYAFAEKEYKVILSVSSLKLRDEKMPVTLIEKVVLGLPEVADARFKRDVAKNLYEANLEAINGIKLQLRLLDNQIQREWTSE